MKKIFGKTMDAHDRSAGSSLTHAAVFGGNNIMPDFAAEVSPFELRGRWRRHLALGLDTIRVQSDECLFLEGLCPIIPQYPLRTPHPNKAPTCRA